LSRSLEPFVRCYIDRVTDLLPRGHLVRATFMSLVALAAIVGCKGGGSATPVCAVGETAKCSCAGVASARTCLPDRSAFGPCDCGGAAGTGGPSACTLGSTLECTCTDGAKGLASCVSPSLTFGECSCQPTYACRSRKGIESCAELPVGICDYALNCMANGATCGGLSTYCPEWDTQDYCAKFPLLCEWVPVGTDGGVVSGPLELPDGGLTDGPADVAGSVCIPPPPDAGVDGGAACGSLEPTGPCVSPTTTNSLQPRATGGALVAGTYELVAWTYYGYSSLPKTPRRQTLVISGAGPSFMAESVAADATQTAHAKMRFTPVSNYILLEGSCPRGTGVQDYTATGDLLQLYEGAVVTTYQRR
jgi:hypothetical protein